MVTGANDGKEGRREAHTGAEIAGNPPLPAGEVDPRPLADALKAALEAEAGHQPGLFDDDEPELPETLPIGGARSRLDAQRGRGRPLGAGNKRSELLREQLLKLGFAHPLVTLATIASSTPDEVAAEMVGGVANLAALPRKLRVDVGKAAVKAISDAADRLAPYFESKRPQQIDVQTDARHLFVVGRIDATAPGSAALSIGGENGNPFVIQEVSEIDAVRTPSDGAHDKD
ncbi:hypothetical protein [Pleomorphomonas koreensis]|uniref:hypothetical protein n=1 Tax=Pleomorphomonas koreensis TaxID=257440 RepID=UPI000417EF26|nr:hypothetical protein [Pleomorphomonas koreensis]